MTLTDILEEIKQFSNAGELLSAIDLAQKAAEAAKRDGRDEDALALRIQDVTLLARMGAALEAQERFEAYGLGDEADSRAKSLKARLRKDLAFAEGEEETSRALLRESRDLYLEIARGFDPGKGGFDREQFEYNGINAVTLHRLATLPDVDLANGEIGHVVDRLLEDEPLDTYYSWATRAELLLNLKGTERLPDDAADDEIAAALAAAIGKKGDGVSSRATTLRQLERIEPGGSAVDVLRPGPVLHYAGHMIAPPGAATGRLLASGEGALKARIAERFDQIRPSSVFGSLASGADILIVEEAHRRGIETHVYLPFALEDFIAESIRKAGGDWEARANTCLGHALCRLTYLTEAPKVKDDILAFGMVSRYAMGSAILHGDFIGGRAEQLIVWDGIETFGPAGAAADRRSWLGAGRVPHVIDVSDLGVSPPPGGPPRRRPLDRTPVALVFGDVKNFSKLGEAQLPHFVDHVMGAVAAALGDVTNRYGHTALSFRNTWGDGVFAVFPEASAAAYFALSLQGRMAKLDLVGLGLPRELAIRLGLHYGAAYERIEPVTGLRNFFGEAVARAARVEPVTTAGRVFATHEFAAELALDPESPARAEYVGDVPTAKNYGNFRLFGLLATERFVRGDGGAG